MNTSVNLVLDTRRMKKDGTYPLVLRIVHKRKSTPIYLGHSLTEEQWDDKKLEVRKSYKGVSSVTRLNKIIQKKRIDALDVITKLEDSGDLEGLSVTELKERIVGSGIGGVSFYEYVSSKADEFYEAGRYSYASSMRELVHILKKSRGDRDLKFDEVNFKFLKRFEAYYLGKGNSVNSLAIYMRNIRAMYNRAIKEGLVKKESYPFVDYKIKTKKTRKRAVPRDVIEEIEKLDLENGSRRWHARNYFLFSFYAMGINIMDIAHLKPSNLKDGRLEYTRKKTKKQYSIKINPKMQEILSLYPDSDSTNGYLFPIIKNPDSQTKAHGDIVEWRRVYNRRLKEIGEMIGLESPLTSYVARHSWATIAKRKGVPVSVISEGMGHEDVRTTEVYLDSFEQDVLDDYNDMITN